MQCQPIQVKFSIASKEKFHYHVFRKHWGTNNLHFPKPQGHFKPMVMFSDHLIKKLALEERQLLSVIYCMGKKTNGIFLIC